MKPAAVLARVAGLALAALLAAHGAPAAARGQPLLPDDDGGRASVLRELDPSSEALRRPAHAAGPRSSRAHQAGAQRNAARGDHRARGALTGVPARQRGVEPAAVADFTQRLREADRVVRRFRDTGRRVRANEARGVAQQHRTSHRHPFDREILDRLRERCGCRVDERGERRREHPATGVDGSARLSSRIAPGGSDPSRCVPSRATNSDRSRSDARRRYQTQFTRRLPASIAPSAPGTR